MTNLDKRTKAQNRLIHQFCKITSESLNDCGLTVTDVIKYETNWTANKVKELIFKPVVKDLYEKDSTTKLDKKELDLVFDTIIRALATKGIDTKDIAI
jgi:hypothetical protein